MQVPICPICGRGPLEAPGDYHFSADYTPLLEEMDGQAPGVQWHCNEHMPAQDTIDALTVLDKQPT